MEYTFEEAQELINTPKKTVEGGELQDILHIVQTFPLDLRLLLRDMTDGNMEFVWSVKQSGKNTLRMSLHVFDNESKTGLVRVDYHSPHKNPERVSESLPSMFHRHAGERINSSHIHYHVEGYRPLVWAVPLDESLSSLHDLGDESGCTVMNAVLEFSRLIHLETRISFQPMIL